MQQNVASKVVAWQRHLFRVAWSLKILQQHLVHLSSGLSEIRVSGGDMALSDFGRSVNPISTRGQIMAIRLLVPPSHFYTLLRPCFCFAALKRVLRQRFYLGYIKSTLFCGLRITSVVHWIYIHANRQIILTKKSKWSGIYLVVLWSPAF